MDIYKILEIRKQYPVGSTDFNVNEVDYITSIIASNERNIGIALPVFFLNRKNSEIDTLKELLFDEWYLTGIYDLSRSWHPYTGIEFNLICFSKTKPKKIKFSKYLGKSTFKKSTKSKINIGEIGKQTITNEYEVYLTELSEITARKRNKFTKNKAELFTVPQDIFDYNQISIDYYHPKLIENQKKLEKEKTVLLSNLVEILIPRQIKDKKGLILSPAQFNYPIKLDKLKKGVATNVAIKKDDILFSRVGNQKTFLVNTSLESKVYASPHTYVIRCKSNLISPEYLFLYLQSDTAKKYVIRHVTGTIVNNISKKYIDILPVIIPERIVIDRSKSLFEKLFLEPKENTIEQINNELFNSNKPLKPVQAEFIAEFVNKSQKYKLKLIKELVDNDLKEINKCLEIKAFKSVIILCGSVLEAVLLDWLSEIDKKNYLMSDDDITLFEMIKTLYRKGYFDNNLKNYAHNIRLQRNSVHPKAYLKAKNKVDQKMIIGTINKLKQILAIRL